MRASGFAEFEEIEDEGACYAFAIDEGRLAFVEGQDFYAGARFPSLDFSLVYVLDEAGQSVDMLIDKRGPKAAPTRIVPAAIKKTLDVPSHLELRAGTLADLERVLRPAAGALAPSRPVPRRVVRLAIERVAHHRRVPAALQALERVDITVRAT